MLMMYLLISLKNFSVSDDLRSQNYAMERTLPCISSYLRRRNHVQREFKPHVTEESQPARGPIAGTNSL